jgi:hypothetical protein
LLAIVVIAVVVVAVRARDEARQLEERQDGLRSYTEQLREVRQSVQETAGAMSAVLPSPEAAEVEALAENVEGWSEALGEAEAQLAPVPTPPGTEAAHRTFIQAISAFRTAAQTYALVPEVRGEARAEVMARAAEMRDLAASMWQSGVEALDRERFDAELDASRLDLPPPQAFPPPEIEEPEHEDEHDGG